jgi:hypothetical protein
MSKRTLCLFPILFAFCFVSLSCQGKETGTPSGKLVVVTTDRKSVV